MSYSATSASSFCYGGNDIGTTAFISKKLEEEGPIFDKSRVNYAPTKPIQFFSASNQIILIVQTDKTLTIIDQKKETTKEIDLINTIASLKVSNLFLDPLGVHSFISLKPSDPSDCPELLYVKTSTTKLKFCLKCKGNSVTAVGWNYVNSSASVTGPVLLGTAKGSIFETEIDSGGDERIIFNTSLEQHWKKLYDFGKGQYSPISAVEAFKVPASKKFIVFVATSCCLYQFIGKLNKLEDRPLLSSIFNGVPRKFELSSSLKYSILSFFHVPECISGNRQKAKLPLFPEKFGWITQNGIYSGTIDSDKDDSVIVECNLIPFPALNSSSSSFSSQTKSVFPKCFYRTDFHGLLAYEDVVQGVCLLNEQVVFEDSFEDVSGLARDPLTGIVYAYSDHSIFKYKIDREERNVWRVYLDKGMFEDARRACSGDEFKLDVILKAEASDLFHKKMYLESAITYSKSSVSFEEIVLKFSDINDKTPLLNYLKKRLELVGPSEATQLTMIVLWILEIYLNELNTEEGKNEDQLLEFFNTPKIFETLKASKIAVYDLLSGHGDSNHSIYFSRLIRDYEKTVQFYIQNREYSSALFLIEMQSILHLLYRHGTLFMRYIPSDYVSCLIRCGTRIDPLKILPSLISLPEKKTVHEEEAAKYLEFVIDELKSMEPSFHNYLLNLYVKNSRDKLERYLRMFGLRSVPYDIKYALKLCSDNKYLSECVFLYCILGEAEVGVDLALVAGDVDKAKSVLSFAEDNEDLRKKIWLKLARHVVQEKNDVKTAMDFLGQTDLVKIEDILPFFDDFVTIDHFKDAICQSLHDYSKHISTLKLEMEEANNAADVIRTDIQEYKAKHVFVRASDTCSICINSLMSKPFHLFNCGHKFHSDCLVDEVSPHLGPSRRKRMEDIINELSKIKGMPVYNETESVDSRSLKLTKSERLRSDLDDIISVECVKCGDYAIRLIDQPFFQDDEFEKAMKEWL